MSTIELEKRVQKEAAGFVIVVALILLAWCLCSGCNTGKLVTTETTTKFQPDGKTIVETYVKVTEDSRCIIQDKSNAVGMDLTLPDPTGITGLPALCRIKIGWINNDLQNTPSGMAAIQSKDYGFIWGQYVKSYQIASKEELINTVLEKYKQAQAPNPSK